jgi:hypothetical protein
MDLLVRPARPEDACVPLLFESAKPYYTAYAGSERGALKLLHRVWPRPGHAASFEFCHVATTEHGLLIGGQTLRNQLQLLSECDHFDRGWLGRRWLDR